VSVTQYGLASAVAVLAASKPAPLAPAMARAVKRWRAKTMVTFGGAFVQAKIHFGSPSCQMFAAMRMTGYYDPLF
jgi:hypothetical protein